MVLHSRVESKSAFFAAKHKHPPRVAMGNMCASADAVLKVVKASIPGAAVVAHP